MSNARSPSALLLYVCPHSRSASLRFPTSIDFVSTEKNARTILIRASVGVPAISNGRFRDFSGVIGVIGF